MCLILFAYKYHPKYKLILLANRDEFYQRPTQRLHYWTDFPTILAGRDLQGNGTWLGVTPNGRLAAITNYRDPAALKPNAPSRGILISRYLGSRQSPTAYLKDLMPAGSRYNGFNLLVGDKEHLYYFSNNTNKIIKIPTGIHGLSNHLLNTPWPKVAHGKRKLKALLDQVPQIAVEDLFTLLKDDNLPEDSQLPDTGVGIVWERLLSPMFISSAAYGTRCSSVILVENGGRIRFSEQTYSHDEKRSPIEDDMRTFIIEPNS